MMGKEEGAALAAVAFSNTRCSLFEITTAIVMVLLRLDGLPPAPHYGVALSLDSSLKACHFPTAFYVANCDSVVLCCAGRTLPE